MESLSSASNAALQKLVLVLKRRWLLQQLAYTFLFGIVFGVIIYWLTGWILLPLLITLLVTSVSAWLLCNSKHWQSITPNQILLHMNRQFSECEESAELVLQPLTSLTTLQQLQRARVQPKVEALLLTELRQYFPHYSTRPALALIVVIILSFTLVEIFAVDILSSKKTASKPTVNNLESGSEQMILLTKNITITAPPYTGLRELQSQDLNLKLLAGSTVIWQFEISGSNLQKDLFMLLPDDQQVPLVQQTQNNYIATATLNHSGIYYISANEKMLGELHTIAVTADTAPSIQFISPTKTITEFAKNVLPNLTSIVSINDDFGLSRVEILASIASGSGEAVKFRDQTFQFDSQTEIDGKMHFTKDWKLTDLGMQPGDELYFSIRAWDNRQPNPQQSRSASKIIRWLEDEQQVVLSDAVAISFIPEYFKSQRQIIIETKQLMTDKDQLSVENFNDTSRDLAAAQSALKQKYGQFLGDEFDSGTLQSMEDGPELDNDGHAEHDDTPTETAQHEHETNQHSENEDDKSGYNSVIDQFGHAHGEADDGNFIKKGVPSPKLLMKRAIANMWQAELHLQLSEPELALPFEMNALAFLNRAKKAERIYVKRLGFEPPPVSEKRRYQGDLTDINSYQRDSTSLELDDPMQSIAQLLNTLNQTTALARTSANANANQTNLGAAQSILLVKVSAYFSTQLTTNPDDVAFIATLQKIQQADSFKLNNCNACISALQQRLWQILPPPIAAPTNKQTPYYLQNSMLQKYQEFLQQQLRPAQP